MLDRVGPASGKSTYADVARHRPQSGESPDGRSSVDPIKVYLACADDQARHRLSLLLSSSRDVDVVGDAGVGTQAIETAAELQPDAVLVDIDLPGTLDSPATRQLADVCPSASIIVLTSSIRDELIATPAMRRDTAGQSHDDLLMAIRTLRAGEIMVYPPW
jgi:DNA-binding NarL/FixJ family response regulator